MRGVPQCAHWGGGSIKRGQLPQSPPCGGDSPLFKAGAKIAPLRGARAEGPPFYSPVNNNFLDFHLFSCYHNKNEGGTDNACRLCFLYPCLLVHLVRYGCAYIVMLFLTASCREIDLYGVSFGLHRFFILEGAIWKLPRS